MMLMGLTTHPTGVTERDVMYSVIPTVAKSIVYPKQHGFMKGFDSEAASLHRGRHRINRRFPYRPFLFNKGNALKIFAVMPIT